ncbi:YjjG family noncanonical pyrimidine nucleotidase [Enterococcus saccharolyticus]|uniref:YjjG family noncanonical pyrimidine nucleotidase n=1 Tax=Enterococcus saccharolyticus TaxID=41997 RepID=UPI0039E11C49
MRYKTLLFDVDDTLLDFKDAENQALRSLFEEMEFELTPEVELTYKTLNHRRWKEYEQGNMTSEEVVNGRFGELFEYFGQKVDSLAMEKRYRYYLNQGHKRLGNSLEIVQDLADKAELYVVTNGVATTQFQRLTDSKLLPYFKDIFVSETAGYQKPKREFFDYAFSRIPDFNKEDTVIIGDSLTSDIQGGKNAGIDTVWLNPVANQEKISIQPTFHIQTLEEIYGILV